MKTKSKINLLFDFSQMYNYIVIQTQQWWDPEKNIKTTILMKVFILEINY